MEKQKILCPAARTGLHGALAGLSGDRPGLWRYFTNFRAAFEENVAADEIWEESMTALASNNDGKHAQYAGQAARKKTL